MVVLTKSTALTNENAVQRLYSEYKMTKEGVRKDVEIVRQWMLKQPQLPRIPPKLDDEIDYWIENLLRLTKNDVEKVKIAVDSYYKGMPLFGDLLRVPDFTEYVYSDLFDNVYMMLLPNLTPDGLKIMLYGVTTENVSLFQPKDFFRRMTMMLDLQIKSGVDFTGIHVIIYARHGSIGHIAQFDLMYLKKVFKLARRAYPIRLKHTHIIYPPFIVETATKIIRPFLSKKVMSRVSVHKDLESLKEIIPKENLPADFGGTLPTLDELHDDWRQILLDNYEWLRDRTNRTSDETKRPKKDKKSAMKYGNNGSFKELSVD